MYYETVIHIFFYEGKDDFQKECVIMVTKRFQRKEEKMKRISSLLLMCLCVLHLCVCSVSAENVANIKEEESIFMPANGITQSEIVKQIQQYSKAGEKYSFTYKFKNYVKAKVSFAAKKQKRFLLNYPKVPIHFMYQETQKNIAIKIKMLLEAVT